jgi:hypothetical protein
LAKVAFVSKLTRILSLHKFEKGRFIVHFIDFLLRLFIVYFYYNERAVGDLTKTVLKMEIHPMMDKININPKLFIVNGN